MENEQESNEEIQENGIERDESFSLNSNALADLYFNSTRFFSERELASSPAYLLATWMVGIASAIDRIDRNLIRADLGSPRPGSEFLTESWVLFWVFTLFAGLVGGVWAWLIGGWWYKIRLRWAGATDPDKREARLVYIYASLVQALPAVLFIAIITLLFANYGAYWASDELWSTLLIVFPFWSTVVSYKGARACFDVRRGRAMLWFLILPLIFYILAFGFIAALYALL